MVFIQPAGGLRLMSLAERYRKAVAPCSRTGRIDVPDASSHRGAGQLERGWKCAAYRIIRSDAHHPAAPAAIFKEGAHGISQKSAATESAEVSLELLPRLHWHGNIERPGDSDANKAGNISAYSADGRRSGVDAL